ncbi:MAG: ABC transporter ATP-binding protein [Acidimicrobiales bacterium]
MPGAPVAGGSVGGSTPGPLGAGDYAVETNGLTKRFGKNVVVDAVDLRIPRGCAFGYLGPNGAGKTTLIRLLLGLLRADSGSMALLGYPVPSERATALSKVGAIVDEPRFHRHLSGMQNLRIIASAREPAAHKRIGPALERVGLTEKANERVARYSMGMRQRLGVAACLLGDPDLLILDEPMNGLDPAGMREMRGMILGLVDEGRTVVLSSHLLDEVQRTCHAVAIVDRGRVVRQGTIEDLLQATNVGLQIECRPADRAHQIVSEMLFVSGIPVVTGVQVGVDGLGITLSPQATRDHVAEMNRRLVDAGVAVYRLQPVRASLEDWFLTVTTALGHDGPQAPPPMPDGSPASPNAPLSSGASGV